MLAVIVLGLAGRQPYLLSHPGALTPRPFRRASSELNQPKDMCSLLHVLKPSVIEPICIDSRVPPLKRDCKHIYIYILEFAALVGNFEQL